MAPPVRSVARHLASSTAPRPRRPALPGSPGRPHRAAPCRCRRAVRPRSTRPRPADPSPGRKTARRRRRPRRCRMSRALDTTCRPHRGSARRARSVRSSPGWPPFGDVVDVVDAGVVVVEAGVDVDVDVVVDDSVRLPTPAGDPDEQAAASPRPTTKIAAARCDPARRTARTVSGAGGRGGASALLDDSHKPSRLRKVTSSDAPSRSI